MSNFYESKYKDLIVEIDNIENEEDNKITSYSLIIAKCTTALEELRGYISKTGFTDEEGEIIFFKSIKPKFLSLNIFYNKILSIELRKPTGNKEILEKYINKELYSLNLFFENHIDFYKYYRSKSSYWDEYFFTRNKDKNIPILQVRCFDVDPVFSTGFDYLLGEILANEKLEEYLISQLNDSNQLKTKTQYSDLTWTAPKVSICELIYALHASGVFNNTQVEIKKIADYFSKAFNINIGNIYKVFEEIRLRKKSRTVFLDALRERLNQRMDYDDENSL